MLIVLVRGRRATDQAQKLAREWGAYLVGQQRPKPGTKPGAPRGPAGRSLPLMQEAMAGAGFDPRFRRMEGSAVEVTLRDCPFKDLVEEHRDLVCTLHRGLIEGILGALQRPLQIREFAPLAERETCRVVAG